MTPIAAQYAREIRREARDFLAVLSLCHESYVERWRAEVAVRDAARFADRAARNGGAELPDTARVVAAGYAALDTVGGWAAFLRTVRDAVSELDRSIDYTRPA